MPLHVVHKLSRKTNSVSRVLEDKANVVKRIVLRPNKEDSEYKSDDKSLNNYKQSKSSGEIITVVNLWALKAGKQTKRNATVNDINCINLTVTSKIDV